MMSFKKIVLGPKLSSLLKTVAIFFKYRKDVWAGYNVNNHITVTSWRLT